MRRFASIASGLLTVLVACGDDGVHHLPDAPPPPDGAPDSPPGPAAVNITTLARSYETVPAGTAHPGVLVFAVDSAGHVAATATTGADGKAAVQLPDGGSVTVVYPNQPPAIPAFGKSVPTVVVTYAGVKPGDNLTFGDYTTGYLASTGQSGTMTISWPAVTNAAHYRLYSPCYSASYITDLTTQFPLRADCQAATGPLGLAAYDAGDNVIASVFLPAASYAPDSALTITAAQWVTTPASYTVGLANAPTGTGSTALGAIDEFGRDEFGQFWFSSPPYFNYVDPTMGETSTTLMIAGTAPRTIGATRISHDTHAGRIWAFKAGASPVMFDLAQQPWIDTLTIDKADPRKSSWTITPGSYDAVALRYSWNNIEWTLLLPPGTTQLDPSAFPAELAQYLPTSKDGNVLYGCELVDLSSAASYDALRALPEWRVTNSEVAVRRGDEPGAALADCGEGYHF